MIENTFYVIAFDSTHYAIRTEKFLKKSHKVDMIPTPREISVSCGLSVKFSEAHLVPILKDLENSDKTGLHLYKLVKLESGSRQAEEMNWGA